MSMTMRACLGALGAQRKTWEMQVPNPFRRAKGNNEEEAGDLKVQECFCWSDHPLPDSAHVPLAIAPNLPRRACGSSVK